MGPFTTLGPTWGCLRNPRALRCDGTSPQHPSSLFSEEEDQLRTRQACYTVLSCGASIYNLNIPAPRKAWETLP